MLDADGNPIMETADGSVGAPLQGMGLGMMQAWIASQQGHDDKALADYGRLWAVIYPQ